jgi:hypothetical protein
MARKKMTSKKVTKRGRPPRTAITATEADAGKTISLAQLLRHNDDVTKSLQKFAADLHEMSTKIDTIFTTIGNPKLAPENRDPLHHEPRPKKSRLTVGDRVQCKVPQGVVTGILSAIKHAWLSVNVDGKQEKYRRRDVSSLKQDNLPPCEPSDECAHEDTPLLAEDQEIP